MEKRAVIRLRIADPPDNGRPRIAVGPADHFGTSPEEHDRIAAEASKASHLVANATLTQAQLLERLVNLAPKHELRFPFVATLERFLSATHHFDGPAAVASSNDEVATPWRNAGGEMS